MSMNTPIELWGGIECTVNRVGDEYFSQMVRSGHHDRHDDLDRCAEIGIKAIRYPVIWERVAPDSPDERDWSWSDVRLPRLRELGISVIAGLLHHGSGPRYTSLIDPQFPEKFAHYARHVAERYPWLDRYTPVNEPLTTARFSGLYGVWYPHGCGPHTFKEALLNQCRATVLAMREIRQVNPAAQLIQTDDLGKTFSTERMRARADFYNERRWLGWDLLCGRVSVEHPLWNWLIEACGATVEELSWFQENTCPPDILGVNYYVTSERFLDERLEHYPKRYEACEGGERYVDIEAARALASPTGGIAALLQEAWQRYAIPIAITEVHLDAAREDQLRWLAETWHAAETAKEAGADVRAITSWALFGSFDWNCLVTRCNGYYETGAFDVSGPAPRLTAVGNYLKSIAAGTQDKHPVLARPGWWHRHDRFFCEPTTAAQDTGFRMPWCSHEADRTLLIAGATGTLGRAFARICQMRGLNYTLLSRKDLDIADAESVERALQHYRPWAFINAAGYVRVDEAENDAARCYRENALGPQVLARTCARHGVALLVFSSDLVFDGCTDSPYLEKHTPAPLNVYGKSKAKAEAAVQAFHKDALIVRTSSFFGPWDEYNYLTNLLKTVGAGQPFLVANDMTMSPTYVPDLVNACLNLLVDGEHGIWHLTNGHAVTWAEFAAQAAEQARLDQRLLQPCAAESLGFTARRPLYSALGTQRSALMPALPDALDRFFRDRGARPENELAA